MLVSKVNLCFRFSTVRKFEVVAFSIASEISELDPPEHLFRIRLVCTLLDSCGQYFDRGTSKKRLDCFLIYFQVKENEEFFQT